VINVRAKTLSRVADRGLAYAKFKAHKFSYLNISGIGSSYVPDGVECGLACVSIPLCLSLNLVAFHDIIGKLPCEVLPSDMYNNSDKFVASTVTITFVSQQSPCISWPCQNTGACATQYEENIYVCLCAKGYKGKHTHTDAHKIKML
ncbi:unnamed protein product, partial [Pocillopora meandrina]